MSDASQQHQFVVTTTDAVYMYGTDSVGSCYVFKGLNTREVFFFFLFDMFR